MISKQKMINEMLYNKEILQDAINISSRGCPAFKKYKETLEETEYLLALVQREPTLTLKDIKEVGRKNDYLLTDSFIEALKKKLAEIGINDRE